MIGFLCGIYVGQEMPAVPKLKPKLQMLYDKLFIDTQTNPSNSDASSKID